jgi:hypothetical protein
LATFVGRFKIGQIGYMYSRMFLPSQAKNEIWWEGERVYCVHCFFNQIQESPCVLLSAGYSNKVEVEPDKNFMFTSIQMYGLCCDCFKKLIVTPVTGDQICESVSFNCRKDFG